MISARGKVFRDPVHGLIRIEAGDDFVLSLVNTPEFQRLRRIRQLGVSAMTYPGAEHTRFAHSLGVFNFAQKIIRALQRRYDSDSDVVELLSRTKPALKAAALLHDIGHGPFSHTIERAFEAVANHERQTIQLIRTSNRIPNVLVDHGIDPEEVANLVRKTSEHRFLVDIISSQLDADRMDYILRDSLSIGVEYGSFDSQWVLNSMCLGLEPAPETGQDLKYLRLCLEDKRGIPSAEQLIMARMHMSFQVYYHRVTRGWEAHLLCLLGRAAQLAKSGTLPSSTPMNVAQFLRSEGGDLDGDDWLWFDESAKEAALHAWAAQTSGELEELADLSRAFLLREKRFFCAEIGPVNTPQMMTLTRELDQVGQDRIDWWLDDPSFTSYKDYDAVFRAPPSPDNGAISTGAILISSGDLNARAVPAETASPVLRALGSDALNSRKSLCRLYFHHRIEPRVRKILAEVGLSNQ